MPDITIIDATQGNLKHLSLTIPKRKLVVFTGLSGSGKSTLLIDVLFHECQRQHLEALGFQGINKPDVARIRGATSAILASQGNASRNPRSTVGTVTNLYTEMRMVYEKLGVRACPHCRATICAGDCVEETEKDGDAFRVYMTCCVCGRRMDKVTRTHLSFNTQEGACPVCQGLGVVRTVNLRRALDESLSAEDGAMRCLEGKYGAYQAGILHAALRHYGIPLAPKTPVSQYTPVQRAILLHGVTCDAVSCAFPGVQPPKAVSAGRFEGIVPILMRRLAEREGDAGTLEPYFDTVPCGDCHGERLCALSRGVTVNGVRLPELAARSLEGVLRFSHELDASLSLAHRELVRVFLRDIDSKLSRFIRVGLGYLSPDRQAATLSGGEQQRLRLAALLDCDLTDMIYILDEPTRGLHPRDTAGLIDILKHLRDLGNTVLVIEHDPDVMAAADHLVEIGPGAGALGGEVVATGTLTDIAACPRSATGIFLTQPPASMGAVRPGDGGFISIRGANRHNLRDVGVDIPTGCLTSVTGPSGSGKSTLIFGVLADAAAGPTDAQVTGLDRFTEVVAVPQATIARMKRSNVATFSDVYTGIRTLFAGTPEARRAGLTARRFSFNTPGGRCETCSGLGRVPSNMLFFPDIEVTCPTCGGRRFGEDILAVRYQNCSITDVLAMSVGEAAAFFSGAARVARTLSLLCDVGLAYLTLGQTVTTLSGGEAQRLKFARELIRARPCARTLYLLDEPTTGLHPVDVTHFLTLLDRLVDNGNTIVVVEHNQQIIRRSDHVIDLGPGGGEDGGTVVFSGTPKALAASHTGATAAYL